MNTRIFSRTLVALALLALACGGARAGSTINPTVPAQGSNLTSAVVRNNFASAYNDVNNILGKFAGSTAPANQTAMQDWVDTSASPVYKFRFWNPSTATWVQWGSLNINTGAFSVVGSSGAFAATAPLTVTFPSGVTTYGLNADSNFAVNGGNLALAPVGNGHLIANCSGAGAEPTNCAWTSFADQAVGASNGMLPYRTGGSWGNISTGTSGGTIPLNNTPNVFSAAQSIITNSSSFPSPDAGALLSVGNVDGTVTRVELTSAGAQPVVSGRTSLGTLAVPLTLTSGSLMMSFNAHGYDGTSWATTASGAFHVYAEGTWSNTSHPTETCQAVTPSASTTIADQFCLHSDAGVTLGSPTGADLGAGKINVTGGFFVNGTTTGTVSAGTVNQLAWYASSGSVLSGLATANSGVLVTSAGGVPSISTTLPSGLSATGMSLTTPTIAGATLSGTIAGTPTLSGANFVALSNIVQDTTAWSFLGNATSGTANYAPFAPASLTTKASPGPSDIVIIADASASNQLKQTTVSALASAGSVASFDTLTGAITFLTEPLGRLTLQANVPVMTTSQSNVGTLRYDCYKGGGQVPYWNGSAVAFDTIPSCDVTDTMTAAASAGQVVANNVYDAWWTHAGANHLCLAMSSVTGGGGGWSADTGSPSNTARGTGYSALPVRSATIPFLTNPNSIANCFNLGTNYGPISANQGTYLGTVYANANGQVSWTYGGASAGGTAGLFGVWNMYNREFVSTTVEDTFASSTVTSGTIVALDNTGTGSGLNNRVSYVIGIAEDSVIANTAGAGTAGASGFVGIAVGHDTTSAITNLSGVNASATATAPVAGSATINNDTGFHFVQAVQHAITANGTVYGSGTVSTIHTGINMSSKF